MYNSYQGVPSGTPYLDAVRDAVVKMAAVQMYNPYLDKTAEKNSNPAYGTWMGDVFIGRDHRIQPPVGNPPISWTGKFPMAATGLGALAGGLIGYSANEGFFKPSMRDRLQRAALGAAIGGGAGFAGSNLVNILRKGFRSLSNISPEVTIPPAGMANTYRRITNRNPSISSVSEITPSPRRMDLGMFRKTDAVRIPILY